VGALAADDQLLPDLANTIPIAVKPNTNMLNLLPLAFLDTKMSTPLTS
jgi:hypothetical protein